MTLLLVTILGYGYYIAKWERTRLDKCSVMIQADIIAIRKRSSKIPTISYRYEVDGIRYTGTESVKERFVLKNAENSRHMWIEYCCQDPAVSRVK